VAVLLMLRIDGFLDMGLIHNGRTSNSLKPNLIPTLMIPKGKKCDFNFLRKLTNIWSLSCLYIPYNQDCFSRR